MTGLKALIALFFLLIFVAPCSAKSYPYDLTCDLGKGTAQNKQAYGFTITLEPQNGQCHLSILDKDKKLIFEATSKGMQLVVSNKLDKHAQPNAIVQTTFPSYELFVVSLGIHPGLVGQIANNYGFWLQDDCDDHRPRIWTSDGAFQGDEELVRIYHYDLIVPAIVLELDRGQFIDATLKCKKYFDGLIARAKSHLTAQGIAEFRRGFVRDEFHAGEVKGWILLIAFSYLYTDRPTEARRALERMWPPGDQERIWNWMTERRSQGIQRQLKGSEK